MGNVSGKLEDAPSLYLRDQYRRMHPQHIVPPPKRSMLTDFLFSFPCIATYHQRPRATNSQDSPECFPFLEGACKEGPWGRWISGICPGSDSSYQTNVPYA